MRKTITVLFIIFCLLTANTAFSAEVNVPAATVDALYNAAASASAGDVLILADGGIYPITTTVANNVPLTIKTADGAATKARVVFAADAAGEYTGNMFQADAALTLKNIICNGQQGTLAPYATRCVRQGELGEAKLHLDGLEISRFRFVVPGNTIDSLIIENCFLAGNLSVAGGWGGTFDYQDEAIKYAKIQNNTFMFCTFGPFLSNGWGDYRAAVYQQQTLIVDHNTIYNITGAHGPTTMFSRIENVQFTNNLYVNGTMRPNEFFSDKYTDFPQNEDDITDFVDTISMLGPKGSWLISAEMVDSAGTVIDMQSNNISYTSEVLNAWSTRGLDKSWTMTNNTESVIIDPENAYFEEEVTFTDAPATPMFAIEAIADYCVLGNADPVTYAGETPFQGWDWWTGLDATFDLREKSELDMSYNTDATSYTAGIGGFPLGDLNWFPEKKAEWETYLTGVETNETAVPAGFSLAQNYPNPFNPETVINYSIDKPANTSLVVYNSLGQKVRTLVNEMNTAGTHQVVWNSMNDFGKIVPSGIYFYRLEVDSKVQVKKMILMK